MVQNITAGLNVIILSLSELGFYMDMYVCIDGLMHDDCSKSSMLARELVPSYAKPSI